LVDNREAEPRALAAELADLGMYEGLEEVVDEVRGLGTGASIVHLEAEDEAALVLARRGGALPSLVSAACISLSYGWLWSSACGSVAVSAGDERQV
jgi:hypothetical protein